LFAFFLLTCPGFTFQMQIKSEGKRGKSIVVNDVGNLDKVVVVIRAIDYFIPNAAFPLLISCEFFPLGCVVIVAVTTLIAYHSCHPLGLVTYTRNAFPAAEFLMTQDQSRGEAKAQTGKLFEIIDPSFENVGAFFSIRNVKFRPQLQNGCKGGPNRSRIGFDYGENWCKIRLVHGTCPSLIHPPQLNDFFAGGRFALSGG